MSSSGDQTPQRKGNRGDNEKPNREEEEEEEDSPSSLFTETKVFAEEQWQKAYNMLQSNPKLTTATILSMALQRRPPVDLVRFMLRLNPQAASIPKQGPSPLQIAVQNNSSVPVVRAVLEACPFALVATNPGSYLDPLSYAKRFRSKEKDLIELLSLPLNHWISTTKHGGNIQGDGQGRASASYNPQQQKTPHPASLQKTMDHPLQGQLNSYGPSMRTLAPPPPPPTAVSRFFCAPSTAVHFVEPDENVEVPLPPNIYKTPEKNSNTFSVETPETPSPSFLSQAYRSASNVPMVTPIAPNAKTASGDTNTAPAFDPTELNNIKLICLSVLKGYKRLTKEMQAVQKQVQASIPKQVLSPTALHLHNAKLLKQIQEEQQKTARTQLIAMDMKEQHMRAHVKKMERRVMRSVLNTSREYSAQMDQRFEAVVQSVQYRLEAFATRMDKMESSIRAGSRQRRGRRYPAIVGPSTNGSRHIQQIPPSDTCDTDTTPIVFATPFVQPVHDDDDDVRSLLTEDTYVARNKRPLWRPFAVGKRCLVILCQT
jgi:hypothetical protein